MIQLLQLNTLFIITKNGKGEVFLSEEYENMATISFRIIDKNTHKPIENADAFIIPDDIVCCSV